MPGTVLVASLALSRLIYVNASVSCSVVSDSAIPWTLACQAPSSMGFFRREYWSGLPFPSPGDLPDPRMEPESPVSPILQVDSLPTEPLGKPQSTER